MNISDFLVFIGSQGPIVGIVAMGCYQNGFRCDRLAYEHHHRAVLKPGFLKTELQDIPALKEQITKLPTGTPVMVDVKNIKGAFFYTSSAGAVRDSQINTEQFDDLIATIKR